MSQLDDATKQALRLAAVGALLHNLGKINAKFLDKFLDKQINGASNDYLYQHVLGLIAPHVSTLPTAPENWQADYNTGKLNASAVLDSNTVNVLKQTFNLPAPLNDRTDYTIGDLIEYLGQGEPWYVEQNGQYGIEHLFPGGSRLTHLMNRAHRGASGGEKEDIATAQQPDAADLYLSTPFGYETAAPHINNINDLLQQIETVIQQYLASPADPLPLADVIADIRPLLSQAIADTQRPLNDITVGDIGHTGMAFLLTQAAEWILTGRTIDHAELAQKEADNTLFWRVLTVHADSLRYLKEAASLADLRVRQKRLQDTFQKVSQKLEKTLLAVEIYADEQHRLFVFPNVNKAHSAYQAVMQEIAGDLNIDGLHLTVQLSEPVTNHPKDKKGIYIGDEVLKQLSEVPPYDFDTDTIAAFWLEQTGQRRTPICTACNLRPQGYGVEQVDAYKKNPAYYQKKAEERNICCICMDHRSGIAKDWAENELDTTVWLDEVADVNGRLALVVGQWDLDSFIQSINYPKKKEGVTEKQEPNFSRRLDQSTPWVHLESLISSPLPQDIQIGRPAVTYARNNLGWFVGNPGDNCPSKFKNPKFPQLNLSVANLSLENNEYFIRLAAAHGQSGYVQLVGQQFEVVDGYTLKTIDEGGRNKIADLFLHNSQFIVSTCVQVHPTTPNLSFARLRRIWRTTQTFWQTALDEPNRDGNPLIPQVSYRLQIIPQNRNQLDLGRYHTYDLKLANSVRLSVVWDPERRIFITCDNLEYLAKPELLSAPVIGFLKGELTLEEPSGYGGKNKTWGKITVEQAGEMENSRYTPAIPILAEPRTFMALVPADKALAVIKAIRTKYEREMGKVRNRLPLHLGLVFFQRRTPLRAALDAGRRMLAQHSPPDDQWQVETVEEVDAGQVDGELTQGTQQFDRTIIVTLSQGERRFTWRVPAVMGDGCTEDNWYPYVFVETDGDDSKVDDRKRRFKSVRSTKEGETACWLVHAGDLEAGDAIYFTPATFDFQWLNSTARRFEIAYDERGHRRHHLTRPYLLDQLDEIEEAWGMLKTLSKSQLYALRDAIEEKRAAWFDGMLAQSLKDDTFQRFCRDTILTTRWPDTLLTAQTEEGKKTLPQDKADQLTTWASNGLLADAIELHVGIMKEDLQTNTEEENTNE